MERRIILSAAMGHAATHSLELTFAALLAYVGLEFDADLAVLGTVVTAGTFTFGATALLSGFLVDRLGSRTVISASMAAAAVFSLGVATASSLAVLTVALALLGAAIGFYHPAGTSMVSSIRRRRGMAFASHGIAGNAGVALAPAIATGVAVAVDWRAAYVVLAVVALVVAVAVRRLAPSRQEARRLVNDPGPASAGGSNSTPPETRSWLARPLLFVFSISVGMGFIYRGALTFMSTHIERNLGFDLFGWSPEAVAGAMTTVVLLFAFGGQLLGGILSDRMRVERAALPVTYLTCPALALAGLLGGIPLLVVLAAFVVVNFAQQPVVNGLIADYAPDGRRGMAYGVSFFLTFGVGSIAGSIAGLVAERAGTEAAFYLFAGVSAGIAALATTVARGASARRSRLLARGGSGTGLTPSEAAVAAGSSPGS